MTLKPTTTDLAGRGVGRLDMTLAQNEGHSEEKARSTKAPGGCVAGGSRAEGVPSRLSPGDGHRVADTAPREGRRDRSGAESREDARSIGDIAAAIVARLELSRGATLH